MEFLMSYGWAILVVLIAISALAYFGVLNPHKVIPETCILFPGLGCNDHKVDGTGATFVISNGMGRDLESFSITILGDGACSGDSSNPVSINEGESAMIHIACTTSPTVGDRFVRELQVDYTEVGAMPHSKSGEVSTEVEP